MRALRDHVSAEMAQVVIQRQLLADRVTQLEKTLSSNSSAAEAKISQALSQIELLKISSE